MGWRALGLRDCDRMQCGHVDDVADPQSLAEWSSRETDLIVERRDRDR
jgi:hypothetical protein